MTISKGACGSYIQLCRAYQGLGGACLQGQMQVVWIRGIGKTCMQTGEMSVLFFANRLKDEVTAVMAGSSDI